GHAPPGFLDELARLRFERLVFEQHAGRRREPGLRQTAAFEVRLRHDELHESADSERDGAENREDGNQKCDGHDQYSMSTILRMTSVPRTCMTAAAMIMLTPSGSPSSVCMCTGLMMNDATATDGGSPASPQPGRRPCGGSTRPCRLTLKRARMTSARLSSTSARLPPASRCVSTAVTKKRASSTGIRLAQLRSASGSVNPKFCSSKRIRNSVRT